MLLRDHSDSNILKLKVRDYQKCVKLVTNMKLVKSNEILICSSEKSLLNFYHFIIAVFYDSKKKIIYVYNEFGNV